MGINSGILNFTLYPHKDYIEQAKHFAQMYNLSDLIIPGRKDLEVLNKKNNRVCRFCGKRYGETKFQNKAHLIPLSLGNRNLFSDFECDACNHYFKSSENELSNFLGIYRTLSGTKARQGIPGYKSAGETIKARGGIILNDETIIISREDVGNDSISFDKEKGIMTVKYKRNPFSPLEVYKALLKVALSVIPDEEVKRDYAYALDFLMNKGNVQLDPCIINCYVLPFNYLPFTPHVYLFKKKVPESKALTHVMALYFQNMIMSINVPLNIRDIDFYNKDVSMISYPPYFVYPNTDNLILKGYDLNFNKVEKLRDVEDEIFFEMDTLDLKNTTAFDGKTGEIKQMPFDPSSIVKIVIRRNGGPVIPQDLFKQVQ